MERYFVFLVVHGDVKREDCQCPRDVIPTLQSLAKNIHELCIQDKNTCEDLQNSRYLSFDPFLALKDATPTVYFSIVEDSLFSDQPVPEFSSKWQKGEHLMEVLSMLEKRIVQDQDKNANRIRSDKDIEISEKLHELADDLPHQAGVPVDVFWFMCERNNMPIRCHLNVFGALKRLQLWHNANITVLCSGDPDRSSFLKSWQKGLKISITHLNGRDAALKLFSPSVVWQGSLILNEDHSRMKLPGFSLCSEKSKKNNKLHVNRPKNDSIEVMNFDLCIGSEITILCKVQKSTVPFFMFVPVKLGLNLTGLSTKLSARLVEWFSVANNKDIGLIGSIKLIAPSANCLKEKTKEAWFNFVKTENLSDTTVDSKTEEDDRDSHRRICLICGGTEKELNLFVLRAPEHLNGKIQHDLAVIHSSLLISKDQEEGGPLRFPDLTESFLKTEQNLTEVLLCRLQKELSKCPDPYRLEPQLLDQLVSTKWKLLQEEREKLLRAGKEFELEVVKRETLLHKNQDLSMSPSSWPERAWLIRNDPSATANSATVGGTTQFPLLTSVSALSIQDIMEKFRLDGTPLTRDLCPVQPIKQSLQDRHIQVNTSRSVEDIRGDNYPDALAASYHGIEYCLDDRGSLIKDSHLASLQCSHVKLETLSSYVARDHKAVESRPARTVTRAAKKAEQKHNLMKLNVPLTRTKVVGISGKPAVLGRPLKRKSPLVKKPSAALKRKREEPSVEETKLSGAKEVAQKETRSERHKRRLRQVVQKTLQDNGIDCNHEFYQSCSDRLYSLCKSFLKDLRSSHGLNEEMKRLAKSNVQQVIEFETKRKSASQKL